MQRNNIWFTCFATKISIFIVSHNGHPYGASLGTCPPPLLATGRKLNHTFMNQSSFLRTISSSRIIHHQIRDLGFVVMWPSSVCSVDRRLSVSMDKLKQRNVLNPPKWVNYFPSPSLSVSLYFCLMGLSQSGGAGRLQSDNYSGSIFHYVYWDLQWSVTACHRNYKHVFLCLCLAWKMCRKCSLLFAESVFMHQETVCWISYAMCLDLLQLHSPCFCRSGEQNNCRIGFFEQMRRSWL